MKNVFFVLAFMLVGSFSFASSSKIKSSNKSDYVNVEKNINENSVLFLVTHYCAVEDGHYRGEGFGRTARQACRRARRDLRRQQRLISIELRN